MAELIVVAVSLLVGAWVYAATMRSGREGPAAVGFDGTDDGGERSGDKPGSGYTYLRVGTRGPSWRDRLQGFVGLMVLVFVGAAALAFGIYQLGQMVNASIERFFE